MSLLRRRHDAEAVPDVDASASGVVAVPVSVDGVLRGDVPDCQGLEGSQETARGNNMEFDLFTLTLIIGFVALAVMMNGSAMSLRDHIDRVRKESDQRLDQFGTEIRREMGQLRTETGGHVASIRQEMNQFRTEMSRRFDEANTGMNRRFETISHDMADLRERVTRVEETVKTRETPNQNAA